MSKGAKSWEPEIELAEGLQLTADWMKTQITKS
jgi:nucleoside-diphosphate-sugar epimerase